MARTDVAFVLGLAGFLLGGAAVYLAVATRSDYRDYRSGNEEAMRLDEESIAGMGAKVAELDRKLTGAPARIDRSIAEIANLKEDLARLEVRIAALESRAGVEPPPTNVARAPAPQFTDEELAALQEKVFSGKATSDEIEKFWEAAKDKERIKAVLDALEKKVAENPRDVEARMNLARGYMVKLLTSSYGPEMGVWAAKAEEQWKSVLEIDPNHWDAQYSLGISYTNYPEFLNKTPDAIKAFESLRKMQEAQTPEAKHAETYLQLSRLYQKVGRTDDAKAALAEGLRRFPDDADLKAAAETSK